MELPLRPQDNEDNEDNFCVFTQTVMRDILNAKHGNATHGTRTAWGSTHFCNADDTVAEAIVQMTEMDVGALLVMDQGCRDDSGGLSLAYNRTRV